METLVHEPAGKIDREANSKSGFVQGNQINGGGGASFG